MLSDAAIGRSPSVDDSVRAEGLRPVSIDLCQASNPIAKLSDCRNGTLPRLGKRIDAAMRTAIAKAGPHAAPLIKRDQTWFSDMVASVAEDVSDDAATIKSMLQERLAALEGISAGFGRDGVVGLWANAFGTIDIEPARDGSVRAAVVTASVYAPDDEQHYTCGIAALLLRPTPEGWLAGTPESTDAPGTDDRKPRAIVRLRRQGLTLRVVAGDESRPHDTSGLDCTRDINQVTGTYFAWGGSGAAAAKPPAADAPSFDCQQPKTADEEEICADPELAVNDRRLDRAWRQLLPRLDPVTRRLFAEDQREYARSQALQYLDYLHPSSAKETWMVHHTGLGRDWLYRVQLERIAALEGFEETRRGFEGLWMANNARLMVTRGDSGRLTAYGDKWFHNDRKGGREYDIAGTTKGYAFKSDHERTNPDTLERDHGSLVVNRFDDVFAKRRYKADGTPINSSDEPKCKRNGTISSTARLFPVRPSPDIETSHDSR